jgi:hypothetical protein
MSHSRRILLLVEATKELKFYLKNANSRYLQRAEYLIIKAQQLAVIDRRITRNIRSINLRRKEGSNYWRLRRFQTTFSELMLDAESFFYVASKFIDLLFEGLQRPLGFNRNSKKSLKACSRISDIRNNLIEHSHSGKRHIADEMCSNGYNAKYGPYIRSARGADNGKTLQSRAYMLLRNEFVKEILSVINKITIDEKKR